MASNVGIRDDVEAERGRVGSSCLANDGMVVSGDESAN
jgi:hypothetical protein